MQKIFYRRIVDMHLFAIFFHEKICLPFVYHRCVLQIIVLSLCVNLLCCKVCYSKKRTKEAGSIFHCKGLHSIQTIVCFHFFDPMDFFLSSEWLVKDTNLRCLLHLWISFQFKKKVTGIFLSNTARIQQLYWY